MIDADRMRERQPKHAEAVGHADAEMDRERSWRHQPSVKSGLGDDALAREQSRGGLAEAYTDGRHCMSLLCTLGNTQASRSPALFPGEQLRMLEAGILSGP